MENTPLTRLSAFKGQNIDFETMAKHANEANTDPSTSQKIDAYIISGRRGAGDVEEDYIITLLEWYKLNLVSTVVLLLRHVPACIFSLLKSKDNDVIASAVLLCVYNVEINKRRSTYSLEGSTFLLKSLSNVRTLYNIGDQAYQRQVQALTAKSLDAANRLETSSHLEEVPKDGTETQGFENEVRPRVIHVCMQVYNYYIDMYTGNNLINSVQFIYHLTQSGMPYRIPTFEKVVAYTANQIQKPLQKVAVDLKTNAISFVPLEPSEVLAEVKPTHLHMFVSTGVEQVEPESKKRIMLQESILMEFAHTLRYVAFNLKSKQVDMQMTVGLDERNTKAPGAVLAEALYSLHTRGTYQCYEKVILHTQSVLEQL